MAALGFASGLPYALTNTTLQQWLKDAGVDTATITFLSLIGLPYVLKVLWAPIMDRYAPPFLGRRRGWLLLTQIALVVAIAVLALVDPAGSLKVVAIAGMSVAFISASQDIVADAYRADVLRDGERGPGAAVFVSGYRIAMLLTGAIVLILVDKDLLPWRGVYLLSAAMMGIGIVATLMAPNPDRDAIVPQSLGDAIVLPLRDIVGRAGGSMVLLFVLFFRLPDTAAGTVTGLFIRDMGFTKTDIGLYRQFLGGGVTIVAALWGGLLVTRLGTRKSLWLFGALQAISNLGFWALSFAPGKLLALIGVLVIENFCAGLVTAGFFVFLMNQCRAEFSATQYALLSSLMAVAGLAVGSITGVLVQQMGYPTFFLLSVVLGLPGLLLLPALRLEDGPVDDAVGAFPVGPAPDRMQT